MSYSSSIEIPNYFECFALHTLRVFNVLYASLHTALYEPLTVIRHLYRHTVIYGPLTVCTHLYTLFFMVLENNNNNPVISLRPLMDITALISHVFISFAAVEIYDLSYNHLHRCTTKVTNSRPDGLLAQLVEHCSGVREVMGSNPVQT